MSNTVLSYKASPTAIAYHQSDAFVKGIMGPFGSGKSVASIWEMFMRMKKQAPGNDNLRKTRWIIARNTFNELETTTMETWKDWFPERTFGNISRKPPYRQTIKFDDVEAEIIFLALDKPEDQKKLLSFEVTGIFFNEARQIEEDIMKAALGRVGRYPAKKDKPEHIPDDQWPTWSGILLDTNPPDDNHWYYKAAELDNWALDENGERVDPATIPMNRQWHFFKQPSGLSDRAENIENLPGGREYYLRMLGNNTKEWVDVHVHGNYGFIKTGTPVYEGFWNPETMVAEAKLPIPPSGLIYVGIDASGRKPAAVFGHKDMFGRWDILHEFCVMEGGMGAERFSKLLSAEMQFIFPNHDFEIWGDPAGDWAQNTDERTYFDILGAAGITVRSSPGLRVKPRLEAVKSVLGRSIDGKPAIRISPSCKNLIKGFNGGYFCKKVSTATGEADPDKSSRFADVHDALQYMFCGAGEMRRLLGRNGNLKPFMADTNFQVIA